MAELCRKCFIEQFKPSQEEINRIVMSKEKDVCEGCGKFVRFVWCIGDEMVN